MANRIGIKPNVAIDHGDEGQSCLFVCCKCGYTVDAFFSLNKKSSRAKLATHVNMVTTRWEVKCIDCDVNNAARIEYEAAQRNRSQ